MKRTIFLLAPAACAALMAGAPAAAVLNPCPRPYDPVSASADPSYAAFDVNGNLQVCVATNKHLKPQIEDDRLAKK